MGNLKQQKQRITAIRWTLLFVAALIAGPLVTALEAQYSSLNAIGLSQRPASITAPPASTTPFIAPNQTPYLAQNTPIGGASLPGMGSDTTYSPPPASAVLTAPPTGTTPAPIVSSPGATPTIDPYAAPQRKTVFETLSTEYKTLIPQTYQSMKRVCEIAQLDYTLIGGGDLTINEIEGRLQFAIPCRWIPTDTSLGNAPGYFYVAPGARFSFWDGPDRGYMTSPNLFGAYVDVGVEPRINKNFALEAWLRVGLYSDYEKVTKDSWRLQGRVMATFLIADRWQGAVGVMYLDRNQVKILPSGGVIWTPHDDIICRLTFPDPKISMRITRAGTTEWWGYLLADYGGGTWTIKDQNTGQSERTDYNDIRVAVGLEFNNPRCIKGFAEIGGAFGRELVRPGWQTYKPGSALFFRIGMKY